MKNSAKPKFFGGSYHAGQIFSTNNFMGSWPWFTSFTSVAKFTLCEGDSTKRGHMEGRGWKRYKGMGGLLAALPTPTTFSVQSPRNGWREDTRVYDLIEIATKHWNCSLIERHFVSAEATSILNIPSVLFFPKIG